ncbi:serine/threonine-protein kinase fray2-like [Watersipora subatra]|uniref:serine/threonine-protein kinase fray2-like n=1 Tax=Watersipora subatra TaxID=2589382 RepID=UPI00355AF0A4
MDSGFPNLVFGEHGDGSWERFIEEMNLCIGSAVERRSYVDDEDGNRVPIMRGRARLVPLLRAIEHSGREILRGAGFNVDGVNSTYEEAVEVLQDYYGRQEMAVNRLRDREVSRDLMKNANLTWGLLHEALRAREMANNLNRFLRTEGRSTDLKSEVKREVAKVSEFDSRAQYRSNDRDRSYDSAGRSSPRGSPRSSRRYYGSEEHDTSRYGTRGRESNNDSDSRKYRDNYSRERHVSRYRANNREGSEDRVCYNCRPSGHEMRSCLSIKCFPCRRRGHVSCYCRNKGEDVGYDRRGSSRKSGGSRDISYERYDSRERCRRRESLRETRDKLSRYRDNSINRLEGEKYKDRRETIRYDERSWDNSKGRSVSFSGLRDKYDDES